jgi:transposase
MKGQLEYNQRLSAIHLLRSGLPARAVSQQLGQSLAWVYKWRRRYFEH